MRSDFANASLILLPSSFCSTGGDVPVRKDVGFAPPRTEDDGLERRKHCRGARWPCSPIANLACPSHFEVIEARGSGEIVRDKRARP